MPTRKVFEGYRDYRDTCFINQHSRSSSGDRNVLALKLIGICHREISLCK